MPKNEKPVLDDGAEPPKPKPAPTNEGPAKEPLGAYLENITVEGFRGIGPRKTLDLPPGPGLTLVVGRNGSGKSSFAIEAEFLVEGEKGSTKVASAWKDGADLADAKTYAQIHGKPRMDLAELGWDQALATYRPFLSYNELGSMLDEGPSKLKGATLPKVRGTTVYDGRLIRSSTPCRLANRLTAASTATACRSTSGSCVQTTIPA